MKTIKRLCAVLFVSASVMFLNLAAKAAEDYPNKPIRLIAVGSPGGGSDRLSRLLAPYLAKELGQNVVVDNQPGGAGAVAIRTISISPPDGYTIFFTSSENSFGSLFTKDSADLDIEKKLAPISLVASSPLYLVANYNLPFNTLSELVAYAKANPGKLNFGSPGPTAVTNLWMHAIDQKYGLNILHVTYRAGGAATSNAVRTNEMQLTFGGPGTAIGFYKEKWAKPIAVSAVKRQVEFPDVPTFPELGIPELNGQVWMIYCRVGTPKARIERLNVAAVRVLRNPEVVKRLNDAGGYNVIASSPEALGKEFSSMKIRIAEIAKKAGVESDD